ncbi:hypothetical protein TCAL_07532 [Tigriopus californicus]|uniref:Major facilitator superfamily (MFS) profile domain-containing protein n=1 Tax=Tigriopus californicus TaxID=6832 RepID=A0A553NXV1_TIGCA|nr:hypothetical protein TCAL_07532 [Tigriopus californicus]
MAEMMAIARYWLLVKGKLEMKPSPSSSEGALTSLRLDLPLHNRPGSSSVDAFLAHLGDPGRFQIVVMILLASNCIPVVVNHLLMAFYAVSTSHNCRVPPDFVGDRSLVLPPPSSEDDIRHGQLYSKCHMYTLANSSSNVLQPDTQPCLYGYEFHFDTPKEWNIIAEWGLVCDRAFVAPLVTTIYFCGVMIGGLIFGSLSDRFGRKNMMLVCLYTQCIIGIGLHFVRRLVMFMGLRFFQGIFIQGLQCVTYSMVMELFSPEYRTMAGCAVEAFWAVGIVLLAVIAKYVQHWRYIQLAINIPTLATIFYIWIIPESVRWLLSRGKLKRAEDVVIRIASYNSLRFDRTWLREEIAEVDRRLRMQTPDRAPGIRDVLGNKKIRKHSLVLFFIWFSVSLSYYGISYSIPNLSGDRYLNFMIGGGIELGAYLLAFVVLNGFGRKYPLMIYLFLSGGLCIGTVAVRQYVPDSFINVPKLVTALALIGKAAVVSCFCSIFIFSSEIFPTVIRTVGVGSCAFFGRVGSLLAPQILLLGKFVYGDSPQFITFLVFGVLSIMAGFLTVFLPETRFKGLPDTVRQASVLGEDNANQSQRTRTKKKHSLLRNPRGSEESLQDEAGYGKSPEWVEVDGMIVSRGVLDKSFGSQSQPSTLQKQPFNFGGYRDGSIASLPYSSRTLLTNSSRSTTLGGMGYDANQRRPLPQPLEAEEDDFGEENPYETLPHIDSDETHSSTDEPRVRRFPVQTSVQMQRLKEEPIYVAHPDDSVTSGHSFTLPKLNDQGLANEEDSFRKSQHGTLLHRSASISQVSGFLKDRILLSDDLGNETRL